MKDIDSANFIITIPPANMSTPTFDIPKQCKAGVVYNEGPDFELKVEMVDVPEPG